MIILAFLHDSRLTSHLLPQNQTSDPLTSENGKSGSISPSQNENPISYTTPSQIENSGPSPPPENEKSDSHLLNPENQNTGLLLPSDTESLGRRTTSWIGKIYYIIKIF